MDPIKSQRQKYIGQYFFNCIKYILLEIDKGSINYRDTMHKNRIEKLEERERGISFPS